MNQISFWIAFALGLGINFLIYFCTGKTMQILYFTMFAMFVYLSLGLGEKQMYSDKSVGVKIAEHLIGLFLALMSLFFIFMTIYTILE